MLIRTEALALEDPTVTEGSPQRPPQPRRPRAAAASAAPAASGRLPLPPRLPRRPHPRPRSRRRHHPPRLRPTASAAAAVASPAAGRLAGARRLCRARGRRCPGPRGGVPTTGRFGALATALQERVRAHRRGASADSVGAVVSAELIQQTFLLIIMGSLGIMLWITFRFRDLRMGVTALVALLHDVIVMVGIFAILGTFIGLQIDALFVTAMLTVIGFSVHDTIVVFDRVRENRVRHVGDPFDQIVNHSIMQTLGRSINTSLTVVLTLLALFLFGGEAIHPFVLALLIGVISGTYSSVFVAVPLLLDWHLWDDRRRARARRLARRARRRQARPKSG